MKPRNKFETYVLGLSKSLKKPLLVKHKKWAIKEIMTTKYYTTHYSKFYCLECGNLFKAEPKDDVCTCSSCKGKLNLTHATYEKQYFGIYDVFEGLQVHRIFSVEKNMGKNKAATYSFSEVMQYWINNEGKIAFLSKKVQSMGYYYDYFYNNTELEIADIRVDRARCIIVLDNYPDRNIIPILTRNGFVPDKINIHPSKLMVALIKDKTTEFLMKLGQDRLVGHQVGDVRVTEKIINYKNQIRIATKHGYIIKDCIDYFDYLDLLVFFNKDINNPFYLCPTDLQQEHDRLVAAKARIDSAKKKETLYAEFKALDRKYKRRIKKFIDIKIDIEEKGLTIKVPQSVEDFYDAGVSLKHCIYTNKYFDKKNTLLLFTYKDGEIFETTEVDIKRKDILQSRGFGNKPTKFNSIILETVSKNMSLIFKQ